MSAAMTPNLPSLQRSGPAPADSFVLAAGLIIVSGAALGLVAVSRLAEGNLPLSYGLWVALSGAVGAWAGLAASGKISVGPVSGALFGRCSEGSSSR